MKDNIKNKLRSALNEVKGVTYDYGCVMIYFDIPNEVWSELQSMIPEEEVSSIDGYPGRESEPHVTILYGLHSDIPDETIEELVGQMSAPNIKLQDIGVFNNEEFDVVKFDVEGEDLHRMNKMFTKLPHTTKYPDYHPHTTIAYVKPGDGNKYVGKIDKPIMVKPNKVVYSKADGSKINYKFK